MKYIQVIFSKYPLLSRIVFWLLLPLGFSGIFAYKYLAQSLPVTDGILFIDGIKTVTTVKRDKYSIPHINSESDMDAYFSLGFLHAQDRLWQMEMNRRRGAGRLSEVLGEQMVTQDKFAKTLGLYRNAKKMWENLGSSDREILLNYVDGVNTGIEQLKVLPSEFLILGYEPEEWKPEDSLVWMQVMSLELSSNFAAEIKRSLLVQNFGFEKTNDLMPQIPLSELESKVDFTSSNSISLTPEGTDNKYLKVRNYIGSNSWVINGTYTENGLPLMANDPHLTTSIPSIWYLAGLKGDKLDVVGATFPGLPFVVIGKNKNIAWSVTTMMADTQDIVLEKINPLNRNQYEIAGKFIDMDIIHEQIKVRKDFLRAEKTPIKFVVRRTLHGPVISDFDNPLDNFAFSLRWTGDDQDGGTFSSFVKLNYASNWQEFNNALSTFVAPIHNFLYADRVGNIGLLSPGKYPKRKVGKGSLPTIGWASSKVWAEWIPYQEVPRVFNPKEGVIVTANNKIINDKYPHHITYDWVPNYRAERIKKLIKEKVSASANGLNINDMLNIQKDVSSPASTRLLPQMLELISKKNQHQKIVKILERWDGDMDMESNGAIIFETWLTHFSRLLIEDDIADMRLSGLSQQFMANVSSNLYLPFLEKILKGDSQFWCEYKSSQAVDTCADILIISLNHAINELKLKLGTDIEDWKWASLHKTQYPHFPFSNRNNILNFLYHRDIENMGSSDTVNVAPPTLSEEERFNNYVGPTYRQVIDLSSKSDSQFIQTTGQSGNILSTHYDDLIKKQRDLELVSMNPFFYQHPQELLVLKPKLLGKH